MRDQPGQRMAKIKLGSTFLPGCVTVFAVFAVGFVLSVLPTVGDFVRSQLLLVPGLALGRQPWRLLSAPLFVLSPFSLLFLGLLLWSIGSAIEQRIGHRRFVGWSAGVLVVSSIAAALLGRLHGVFSSGALILPVLMEGGPVFSMVLLAFAQLYSGLQVKMWGVPQLTSAKTLAWFFIGIGLFANLLRAEWELLGANLVTLAMTFALLTDHGAQSLWRQLRRRLRPDKSRKFQVLSGGRRDGDDSSHKWLN